MTSTSGDADENLEGNSLEFSLSTNGGGGELEMVMWARVRGMMRGVADRKESSEARRVGSAVDDSEFEGGK